MLTRTYQIEQSEGVLTIRASRSDWWGWRVAGFAFIILVVVTIIVIVASIFVPGLTNYKFCAIACFWLSGMAYSLFSPWECVLDSKTDEVRRIDGKAVKLSEVAAARYDAFLCADKGRGVPDRNALYLQLADGRQIPLRMLFITRFEDAAMGNAATRINAFLAEKKAEPRHWPMIWSWEQGKDIPA